MLDERKPLASSNHSLILLEKSLERPSNKLWIVSLLCYLLFKVLSNGYFITNLFKSRGHLLQFYVDNFN